MIPHVPTARRSRPRAPRALQPPCTLEAAVRRAIARPRRPLVRQRQDAAGHARSWSGTAGPCSAETWAINRTYKLAVPLARAGVRDDHRLPLPRSYTVRLGRTTCRRLGHGRRLTRSTSCSRGCSRCPRGCRRRRAARAAVAQRPHWPLWYLSRAVRWRRQPLVALGAALVAHVIVRRMPGCTTLSVATLDDRLAEGMAIRGG